MDDLESLAKIVVDCGFKLHRDLGPGMLESVYEQLLAASLERVGLTVEQQVAVPIRYDGIVIDNAFRIDLLINRKLIVEIKSVEKHSPVHAKQLLTYLRLMHLPLGLFI